MWKNHVFHANAIQSGRLVHVQILAVHVRVNRDSLDKSVQSVLRATVDRIVRNVHAIREERCRAASVRHIVNAE